MRVLVIGGYGLIGGYVVAALAGAGHAVVGAGRNIDAAARRYPFARWVRVDLASASEADWKPLLEGVDAVVNCAGALQDGSDDRLSAVHNTGVVTLARAMQAAGVSRLVHISAAGVANGPGAFAQTKRAAEVRLGEQPIDWVVLRPGLVLAPAAFGGSALLRGLAAFPFCIPAVYADSRIQVVHVEDVAQAVVAAVRPEAPSRIAVDLVSTEAYALRDILARLRAWLGFPPAPVVEPPAVLARVSGAVADTLGWLGWRSPMRTAALLQLRHGVRGDAASVRYLPGVRVRSLDESLADAPSGVQERWFAKLYFLKPLGLLTLALFWAASGLVGLAQVDRAAAVLRAAGFSPTQAGAAVLIGSAADLALAALVCHRRSAASALKGMVAVSAAYLIGASLWRPNLWGDPLGPLTKVIPTMVLALAMLAVLDER